MRTRPWLILVALLAVAGVLVAARGLQGQDPDWHSSRSDGPKGTSALVLYAQALGRPVQTLQGSSFQLPATSTTLFVFDPFTEYTAGEAGRLKDWVSSGGTLVYADDGLDSHLGDAFEIEKRGLSVSRGVASAPYFEGVRRAGSETAVSPLRPTAGQAVALRTRGGAALALVATLGSGRLVALADPLLLCNGFIGNQDNWRLAALLIELSPAVAIDEYHHDFGHASSANDWSRQPLGIALLWGFAAVFVGVALRNRGFGPRLRPYATGERSSAEHVSAVGRLLRRYGGRGMAADLALAATRRALIERTGISRDAPPERLAEVLARSAPELAAEWTAAERAARAAAASGSDQAVAAALARLHALAHPRLGPAPTILR
ncbi:MAG: DUF4350 domain-containing protein [Chloroflexi bacterium]|nr:MAG: DUF4350 domain-containing protein [Chloroflexota bacterium]